ncbi:hypothetical protein CFK37_11285 [Virgibacillus phasianinus]|uniref:MaoC-like domain-containing protein n=1 Tax=Virgibacillus phasianinus TaxID=2017483 RepID=A0A220U321_9BACI|nr:MaoC/PaaZ C-terminal domain-containing protein [Virgibacillus phasianinus]ASK62684.1 hypothetical protein CFK37_11285 [Virgibacillus phasianinus]
MNMTITKEDIRNFASIAGDHNPIHLNGTYAKQHGYTGGIVHGMLIMAKLWNVLSTEYFFGKETLETYTMTFSAPLYADDVMAIEIGEKKDLSYPFKGFVENQLIVKGSLELQKGCNVTS